MTKFYTLALCAALGAASQAQAAGLFSRSGADERVKSGWELGAGIGMHTHEESIEDQVVFDGQGTVGAVALDRHGNLAAATSTGGMTNKRQGRVGDSPIVGAGTYAKNGVCAVSATGHGEVFIRAVAAYHICATVEYRGLDLDTAVRELVHEKIRALGGGGGGIIAVDASGHIAMDFSTQGMFRGARDSAGRREIEVAPVSSRNP